MSLADPCRSVEQGKGRGYSQIAREEGGLFYESTENVWLALGKDPELGWAVNEAVLVQQMEKGVSRIDVVGVSIEDIEASAPGTSRFREIRFLKRNAAAYGYKRVGNSWIRGNQ